MYEKYVKDIMDLYDKEQEEYEQLENKKLPHEKEHEQEDKIHEKYDKLILDVNKKYNIIFRYDLIDAWGVQISTLIITNDKTNNVFCVYDDEKLESEYFTIDSKKISEILSKYEEQIKRINEMEEDNSIVVNDGVDNSFYFDIDGNIYSYVINNLSARALNMKEKAELLSDILTEIREILIKANDKIDKCLTLE